MGTLMIPIRGHIRFLGGALALAALSVASATPAEARVRRHHRTPTVAAAPAFAFNSFTPAAADPRFSFGVGDAYNDGAFRFTPSNVSNNRRAITVAVRS